MHKQKKKKKIGWVAILVAGFKTKSYQTINPKQPKCTSK